MERNYGLYAAAPANEGPRGIVIPATIHNSNGITDQNRVTLTASQGLPYFVNGSAGAAGTLEILAAGAAAGQRAGMIMSGSVVNIYNVYPGSDVVFTPTAQYTLGVTNQDISQGVCFHTSLFQRPLASRRGRQPATAVLNSNGTFSVTYS